MKEIYGNIWSIPCDAICITTNGIIRKDGRAVMGAGIARQARDKFPNIDLVLAGKLKAGGNVVHVIHDSGPVLVSFPTKNHWKDPSDIGLIGRSAEELVRLANHREWSRILLPRPGCGNGRLNWDEVKARLNPLDDRFYIITFGGMER